MQSEVAEFVPKQRKRKKESSYPDMHMLEIASPTCVVESLIDVKMQHWFDDYVPECAAEDVLNDYVGECP